MDCLGVRTMRATLQTVLMVQMEQRRRPLGKMVAMVPTVESPGVEAERWGDRWR